MNKILIIITGILMFLPSIVGADPKPWSVLGFFDCENAELERICEYNINQLEEIDDTFADIVVLFDRTYTPAKDSSVRIYDIGPDTDRREIISNSVSIGERDMGMPDVLDEFLSKYLGPRNILIIKAHGYGIVPPALLKIGYNSPQDPVAMARVMANRLSGPIEVMIFDSCNMASVEVAYEFKGLVSVLVASQDLMYYSLDVLGDKPYSSRPGIDYIDLVLKLTPHSNPITIGKDVVAGFTDIVSKKDARFSKATISALDLNALDVSVFKRLAEDLQAGMSNPETRSRYMAAIKTTLDTAIRFQPLGRNRIFTHYDIESFLSVLEANLDRRLPRPGPSVIQSYSNNYIRGASGLSILFFKDLSDVSDVRKRDVFEKYARSRFAKVTGWGRLMKAYHQYGR